MKVLINFLKGDNPFMPYEFLPSKIVISASNLVKSIYFDKGYKIVGHMLDRNHSQEST